MIVCVLMQFIYYPNQPVWIFSTLVDFHWCN